MIMHDMDRALTMNPTMVDMRNMRHWVDRAVWTETLGAAGEATGAVAIARRGRVTAHMITTITTSDDGKAIFTRSFDQVHRPGRGRRRRRLVRPTDKRAHHRRHRGETATIPIQEPYRTIS